MEKKKRARFVAFQLKQLWGVLDRKTGELTETASKVERFPQAWARNKADQLNEKD